MCNHTEVDFSHLSFKVVVGSDDGNKETNVVAVKTSAKCKLCGQPFYNMAMAPDGSSSLLAPAAIMILVPANEDPDVAAHFAYSQAIELWGGEGDKLMPGIRYQ